MHAVVAQVEDQVSQMLDDHIVMTQSMTFSPYKKPFEERINKWEAQLSLVSAARHSSQGLQSRPRPCLPSLRATWLAGQTLPPASIDSPAPPRPPILSLAGQ